MSDKATESGQPVTVVVVDDHDIIHSGIRTWCAQSTPAVQIAGSYLTIATFLETHTDVTAVDAVILDLELRSREPDFDAIKQTVDAGHRVIVFSHLEEPTIILTCLQLGAKTYLAKSEGQGHLLAAIHALATGQSYVGPLQAAAIHSDTRDGRPHLTDREREVLKTWFQTESKEIVALQLNIAPGTVKKHLDNISAKYAAIGRPTSSKAELLANTLKDGTFTINEF
ncbi:response regulator [Mycobacteroides saopaulense]|uniref:response regulator n=1 Tax=Mycobacteroides saopaulense TaxID=1578165 RepID=UPI0009F44C75|nr:response regulator [Mycobacteroides saopaulense]